VDGYVDLTPEELLAALALVGAPPPPHLMVVGERLGSDVEVVQRAGRRSLLARGIVQRVDDGLVLDAELEEVLRTIGEPGMIANATAVGAEVGMAWLFVTPDSVASINVVEEGIQRVRCYPAEYVPLVLERLGRLQDLRPHPGPVDDVTVELPDVDMPEGHDLVGAIAAMRLPEPDPERGPLDGLLGEDATVRSIAVSVPVDEGEIASRSLIWVATAAGLAYLVDEGPSGSVTFRAVDPDRFPDLLERLVLGDGAAPPEMESVGT
jgi:hypothetical protein